jgi:phosphomannomutase
VCVCVCVCVCVGVHFRRYVSVTLVQSLPTLCVHAGVMVTASHNPKCDDGYKVYAGNGSQIISPVDKQIADLILANLQPWGAVVDDYKHCDEKKLEANPLLKDVTVEAQNAYFAALKTRLCRFGPENAASANDSSKHRKMVYTAMHGVGTPFAVRAFEAFSLPALIQTKEMCQPDPDFPLAPYPNPEEGKGLSCTSCTT